MNNRRFATLIIGLSLLAFTAGFFALHAANAQSSKKPIDFTMRDTNGKKVKLSSYRGKVVIVDVWATWCGYCVRETPGLISLQAKADKQKNSPYQIIGVSKDTDKEAVKEFVKTHKVNYPILYAEDKQMKPFGEVYGLPTKFIIDKRGVIVDTIVGAMDEDALQKRIEKFLK